MVVEDKVIIKRKNQFKTLFKKYLTHNLIQHQIEILSITIRIELILII